MNASKPTPPKFSSYQLFVLILLASLQWLVMLDFMIISPIGYILVKDIQLSTQQFGTIVSSYIFAAACSGIVSAGFIDNYDRKKVLIFFVSGFIIGTLCCAWSSSYYSLLTSRIFTGIFGGVISSISMTIVSDLFVPNQRGRAMSFLQMAFAAAQILGIPLGLLIAGYFSWHATFYFIVLLSLPVLILAMIKIKPLNEHLHQTQKQNPALHWWRTVKNKHHRLGYSATICLGLGMMLQPFMSIFLTNNLQVMKSQIPPLFMVTGAAAFFIMPLVGKLSDKYGKFKLFLIGSLLTMAVVPIYTQVLTAPFALILVLNVIMFTAIASRMGPFQAMNSMIPEAANRGSYLSLSASLSQLSGGLGIVIAGSIVSQSSPESPLRNFDILGYVVLALTLLATYLVYRVHTLTRKNNS